jgi:hypothetical protein
LCLGFTTTECISRIETLLRRDNPKTQEIHMILGRMNVIGEKLIPLMVHYRDEQSYVFHCGTPLMCRHDCWERIFALVLRRRCPLRLRYRLCFLWGGMSAAVAQ